MGLDTVELVLTVEEEFEVGIDDSDAANLYTPRLLADYIVSRLRLTEAKEPGCLSQAGFHRIRSALVGQFGARRNDIRPASRIDNWLKGNVRRQWRQLATAVDATQLPPLECRKSIYYPLTLGMPLLTAALLGGNGFPLWLPFLSFFVAWLAANMLADRLADIIPPAVSTVGRLTAYVRPSAREQITPEYVLQRVIQITGAQTGLNIDEIHPDHHFVKDLHLD